MSNIQELPNHRPQALESKAEYIFDIQDAQEELEYINRILTNKKDISPNEKEGLNKRKKELQDQIKKGEEWISIIQRTYGFPPQFPLAKELNLAHRQSKATAYAMERRRNPNTKRLIGQLYKRSSELVTCIEKLGTREWELLALATTNEDDKKTAIEINGLGERVEKLEGMASFALKGMPHPHATMPYVFCNYFITCLADIYKKGTGKKPSVYKARAGDYVGKFLNFVGDCLADIDKRLANPSKRNALGKRIERLFKDTP